MQISLNTSKWYQEMWAAFIYFTRLPLWRIYQPKPETYQNVTAYWPLTGWLTGGLMAVILYFGTAILPYSVIVMTAIGARMILTGAFHEDGLADFFDGFGGGGTDKQRILAIMKDSHIGTFGTLSLIIYVLLLFFLLYSMPPKTAAFVVFAGDAYAKMVAVQLTQMLPYARTASESKANIIYKRFTWQTGLGLFAQGMLPFILLLHVFHGQLRWDMLVFTPCVVMYSLYLWIKNRLQGYTGDCCGATFLLIELSFYTVMVSQLDSISF